MENTFITALANQTTLQQQMGVVANNIANMSTPGFKAQNLVFSEYIEKADARVDIEDDTKDDLSLVYARGQFENTLQGTIRHTGNTLDVALEGKGYFGVVKDDDTYYSRAGSFTVNAIGELVTSSGNLVAGEGGGAINIPSDAKEITITHDGTISTDQGSVGKLMITEFDSVQALEPKGNGLYAATEDAEAMASTSTKVLQGALEGSNVQPIVEMTRMIEISRAYQRAAQTIQTEHDRQRSMIQRLSKSS